MTRKNYIDNNEMCVFYDYLRALPHADVGCETLPTADSLRRVTACAIYANYSDPQYNAAAMDGIAVLAKKTEGAEEQHPLILVENEDFCYVNTGNPIPPKYDAVIMIEDVLENSNGSVKILAPAYPWQHIRVRGESVVAGEMILPSFSTIRAVDIGALVASGNMAIQVIKKPKVAIIPTGHEMVDTPEELKVGALMESNSKVFAALTSELNAIPVCYKIVDDDIEILKSAITDASENCDVIIVNAGSSAGTKDYTVQAIKALGTVYAHGFAIKPGKPTIIGLVNNKPVIGIPGYPVSAYIVYEKFVTPILTHMSHLGTAAASHATFTLTRTITSSLKNEEFVRMSLGKVNGKYVATPLERGAAQIMSLVKADGLLTIDKLSEGIVVGSEVDIELKKPLSEIENRLVVIGSHDLILDVLRDKIPISSSHIGSLGGIMALLKGECHMAPIHLLNEESGEYNISYVKKYFSGKKMALIKGVGRTQGFIVPKGNPKIVESFASLANLRYANRQRGAGTRLLFDYCLKKSHISPSTINGYEKEYNTHLAVASAIENGTADTGLGVLSAALAMNMDFIPIGQEEYDFLISADSLQDDKIVAFLSLIKSDWFRRELDRLGGYTYANLGEIIFIDC